MRPGRDRQLVRDLGRIFGPGTAEVGDRALVDGFAAGGDESAFAELVRRHGPMVRGVCGRTLGDPHDVDDAFQATFLVLFRKGKGLRDADRLGPWLHGVAARVAAKARAQAARRLSRHEDGDHDAPAPAGPDGDLADLMPVLDAEIARLPAKLRAAVVPCLVEGLAVDEAARRLGCPVGTVKSRLARGRAALRARLEGRGIVPSLPPILPLVPVPEPLIRATAGAVLGSRLAPSVVALARGVAPAMISKSATIAALVVGGSLLAGGGLVATWTRSPAAAQQPGAAAPAPGPGPGAQPDPARGRDESIKHMKMIAAACWGYENANGRLPAAALLGADGRPTLSWRVAILHYLEDEAHPEYKALYDEFRRDEPWDSPHNRALISRMPAIFATPDSPAPAGQTRFRGFQGPGTMFDGGPQGARVADVPDGTANTILFVQAREPMAWTKPEEIPFPGDQLAAALDQLGPDRVRVAMTAGDLYDLVPPPEHILKAMITRDGGEVLAQPIRFNTEEARAHLARTTPLLAPAPAAGAGMGMGMGMGAAMGPGGAPGAGPMGMMGPNGAAGAGPTPGATPPESIERRLERVEAKLDRLLQILDRRPTEAELPRPGR